MYVVYCIVLCAYCTWQGYLARSRQITRLFLQWAESGPPPPLVPGEGTLACGRGDGEVPIRTKGQALWYSRYISVLWYSGFLYSAKIGAGGKGV